MVESEITARIAARRAGLDELEDQLVKQVEELRVERDELAVAERVWRRMAEQLAAEAAAEPAPVEVAGRAVLLSRTRGPAVAEDALPPDCRRASSLSCASGGPVPTRQVGEVLGLQVAVRGKLEPLRGKLSKLAGRGWMRKLPDGRSAARL
ncbi:hypothetical protein OG500_01250 [Kitasatospora sp. NBC_01250]|uniref:hypothetical protein n=1 Tax=Kitasatospora sp. NBC_01250 TaxID=2903571 RepID=UPI002E2F8BB6|nr:hypothetical protein [Kitasatospora sp. NBC_01250]